MKKGKFVLGIDTGTASAGLTVIREVKEEQRIEPLEHKVLLFPFKDAQQYSNFINGSKSFQTDNSLRTSRRGRRKSIRNKNKVYSSIKKFLKEEFGWDYENLNLDINKLKIEGQERLLTTEELCSLIFNYTKYRGYDYSIDIESEKSASEYKKEADSLERWCRENNKTVSHYFLENNLPVHKSIAVEKDNKTETKNPPPISQSLHQEELLKILTRQLEQYPQFSSEKYLERLMKIIYFKNPIPSQKHLVADCSFEKGKKSVSSSNPNFEKLRIVQILHNLKIKGCDDEKLTQEEFKILYEKLLTTKELTNEQIVKIIGRGTGTNYKEKIKGSITISEIKNILPYLNDEELYDMWHRIYSHKNKNHILSSLYKKGIDEETALKLADIKIDRTDYCSFSNKAILKLLPYMNGEKGFYNSYNAEELVYGHLKEKKIKKDSLEIIEKNTLRSPVVEKSWNQVRQILNEFKEKYGDMEIRVELSRDFSKSKKVKQKISSKLKNNNQKNELINSFLKKKNIHNSYNNKRRIKLWIEQGGEINLETLEVIKNAIDVYSGKEITMNQTLNASVTNIEHTLCKSRFFDDSMVYLTLTFNDFNKNVKKDRAAFEWASEDLSEKEKESFFDRVEKVYKKNDYKKETFTYGYSNYPTSIPTNQKQLNSYIATKFTELLSEVFDKVYCTNGKTTSWIRTELGVMSEFKKLIHKNHPELFESKTVIRKGKEENFAPKWDSHGKRIDHRHHIIDSFIIAITKQDYIQKLSKLNSRYLKSKDLDQKLKNNVRKEILNDVYGRFGEDNPADVCMDVVKSTLTLVKRPKYPIITKKGCKGFRGAIHKETPIKQTKMVNVFNGSSLNKEITKENIYSKNIKDLVSNYESIEVAFTENNYLKRLSEIKIYIDTTGFLRANNNIFKTGNNHRLDFFEDKGKTWSKIVTSQDLINGYKPEIEPHISFHKKDYFVVGLTEKEVDQALSNKDYSTISKHLFYVAKMSGGNAFIQRHYFDSESTDKLRMNCKNIFKTYKNRIVKMMVFNNGEIAKYQKINSKVTEKI